MDSSRSLGSSFPSGEATACRGLPDCQKAMTARPVSRAGASPGSAPLRAARLGRGGHTAKPHDSASLLRSAEGWFAVSRPAPRAPWKRGPGQADGRSRCCLQFDIEPLWGAGVRPVSGPMSPQSRPWRTMTGRDLHFLRKEVIQPQVPLRLPCYDLVPIRSFTFGACSCEHQRLRVPPPLVA